MHNNSLPNATNIDEREQRKADKVIHYAWRIMGKPHEDEVVQKKRRSIESTIVMGVKRKKFKMIHDDGG